MKTNVVYTSKVFGVSEKNRTVKCVLTYEVNLDKIPGMSVMMELDDVRDYLDSLLCEKSASISDIDSYWRMSENGVLSFKTEGFATCSPSDEFDEELGKKIALTRAQRNAFNRMAIMYSNLYDIVYNALCERLGGLEFGCAEAFAKCSEHIEELCNSVNK